MGPIAKPASRHRLVPPPLPPRPGALGLHARVRCFGLQSRQPALAVLGAPRAVRGPRKYGLGSLNSPSLAAAARAKEQGPDPTEPAGAWRWIGCPDLAVVSRNRCLALGRLRRDGSGARPDRSVTAIGCSHRCHRWLAPVFPPSRRGSRAPRSASPPYGRGAGVPASSAVTAQARREDRLRARSVTRTLAFVRGGRLRPAP